MSRIVVGVVCGLVFGALSVGLMLPLPFPDKKTPLLGAFFDRFGIGVLTALVSVPGLPPWQQGALVGLLMSLPSAIITKVYAPILILGVLGGAACGWAVATFGG